MRTVRLSFSPFHSIFASSSYLVVADTLDLFERLMDRSLRPDPTSPLVLGLNDRLIAAGLEGLQETSPVSEVDEQEDEEEREADEDRDDDDAEEEEEEDDEGTSAPS